MTSCRACAAGLPLIWDVQGRKYMHDAPGLCMTPCDRIEARVRRVRDVASDRGNEDQRGR